MYFALFGSETSFQMTNAATRYFSLAGRNQFQNIDELAVQGVVPAAFTLTNFFATLATAPGGVTGWTFTVRKNGVSTGVSFTISGANTSGSDTTNSVTFAAGDTACITVIPVSTPAATFLRWRTMGDSAGMKQIMMASYQNGFSSTVTGFSHPHSPNSHSNEQFDKMVVTSPGTISNLYARFTTAPGVGKSWTVTVRKNGVDTALVAAIIDNNLVANDNAHPISFAAGDTLSVKQAPAGTPTNPVGQTPSIALTFTPDKPGNSLYYGSTGLASAASTTYAGILDNGFFADATESNVTMAPGPQFTIRRLYVDLDTAPGVGKSWVYKLRSNGADTGLTATIADANKTAIIDTAGSTLVTLAENALAAFSITPVNTPAGTTSTDIIRINYTLNFTAQNMFSMFR